MKFLLWKPGMDEGTINDLPHTGLGILASELKEYGEQIVFIDNHFAPVPDEDVSDYISKFQPDTICLSLVSSEWLLERTQNLINEAHSKGIEVWVGGPHAYGYGDLLVKDERITKIVIGEIDGQIDQILSSREKIIRLSKPANFKSPDFTEMYHAEKIKNYPVFVSRGCNYNCSFCFSTKTHGNRWRKRPLDDAFWNEMSQIKQLFPNVHTISIIDDAFTTNLKHAKTFLKKYIEDQYPFKVTIFNVRADHIDQELLLLFQAVKLETLAIGIESGDESVFKLVNKGEKLTKIKETILHLQEVGVTPWLNMVIGLPGDSLQCHARSMDWVTDIPGKKIVQWLHYAPFRNTWAYEYFVKEGSIHDGFIPPLMSGRYDKLPEEGHFNARAFSKKEKLLAQLEAYLRTLAPILILNEAKVKQLCEENNLMALYDEWKKKAPIEDFLKKTIPAKIEKGQISDWALIKN